VLTSLGLILRLPPLKQAMASQQFESCHPEYPITRSATRLKLEPFSLRRTVVHDTY
jgi:hypothetical protein